MKLSKTKKFILLGASIGILTTMVVTPIVLLNNNDNQDDQNQKDVESVIKILEEKNQDERILKFASNLTGKIVANNQAKIVAKIKTLIGEKNLKQVKIEILMKNDRDISPNYAKIQIKVSKGKYSKIVGLEKSYLVIREQNKQEIIADVNSVKTALTNLGTKTLELKAKDNDKSINGNKEGILKTLEQVSGYSDIKFKDVKIKVKENSNQLPLHNATPINIVFVLSKATYNSELTGFSAKQLDSDQVNEITEELNQLKSSLENLETKEVEVYAPSTNKTITHNKAAIKSAIENLDGYDEIDLNGASLEVKNSGNNLPTNDQPASSIILILSKNNVNVEVQGFSAKQSLTITTQDKINKIKQKITDKDILIAPNVSISNQSEIQSAIKNQLQEENPLLDNNDLSKISTSLTTLTLGIRTEVVLSISIDSKTSILNIYVEKVNLLKGSNITDGQFGTIFQDEFKNLWAMGNGTRLQVLRANSTKDSYDGSLGWSNTNSGLTKGSNITDGQFGTIFQDEFKNLWAMGNNTSLQVLRVNQNDDGYDETTGWTSANSGLTKGSNITNGFKGTIFQDEFKNLWAMGSEKKLQVLRANSQKDGYDENVGWTSANSGLTKGSNIKNGQGGTIFQDEFKNLWTIGKSYYNESNTITINSKLQVLRANAQKDGYDENVGWTSANSGLLKGTNIANGETTIFQDEFKNLWAMGVTYRDRNFVGTRGTIKTKLQVLRANAQKDGYDENVGWTSANSGLTKNSNIIFGGYGTIFQDEFKNLWAMGNQKKLQVLRPNSQKNDYVTSGWTSANSGLTKNSNINDGFNGIVFQDKFKNLWTIGKNSKLQVLKANSQKNGYVTSGWTSANDSGLTNGSNILIGNGATIFQDDFGNLWAMGVYKRFGSSIVDPKIQVLKVNQNGDGYVSSWQNY